MRHLHKCWVSFGNARANKQNPEQQGEVCTYKKRRGEELVVTEQLETDVFKKKRERERERDMINIEHY